MARTDRRIPLPRWMLVHKAVIEPYRAWGEYGSGVERRCVWQEGMAGNGVTGSERAAQLTLFLPLDTDCPQGSRVTHCDGRQGYASAVVRHDGGGLPTPDHLQVAVVVATAYGPAFGEPVILLRQTRGRTATGRTTITRQQVSLYAAVRPLGQDEQPAAGQQGTGNIQVDEIEVVLPPGTQVSADDAIIVRGLTYQIDGRPVDTASSQSTARPGVKVIARRRYPT